jgi:hypothetical protein
MRGTPDRGPSYQFERLFARRLDPVCGAREESRRLARRARGTTYVRPSPVHPLGRSRHADPTRCPTRGVSDASWAVGSIISGMGEQDALAGRVPDAFRCPSRARRPG